MIPITLHIPLEVQSQNVTDRMHPMVRHKMKKDWTNWIESLAFFQRGQIQRPDYRCAVTILAYRKRRITDHANLVGGAKMVCDAIRDAGLIYDDADKWAVFAYSQQLIKDNPIPNGGRPSTVIRVERFPTTTPDTGKDDK